ncbi:MAG TPA: CocE/NonD family hydrolase [Mycobacteriales bacterium]|nr:CocE/NonD family hydrolase [Mycobacteriales bacterium]
MTEANGADTYFCPMKKWVSLAVVVVLGAAGAPAQATSDRGRAFRVPYAAGEYAVSTTTVQITVRAGDGTALFVETWLPVRNGSHVPPRRVPVVAVATPYAFKGVPRPDRLNATPRWTQLIVSHGYALANIHLRGTGESNGCWDSHGAQDADDVSRAIDWLTTAPFSNGRIALFGKSHDGGAALNTAERGDRHRLRGLKALIVASPATSYADFVMWPGIPDAEGQVLLLEINSETRHTGRSSGALGGEANDTVEYVGNGPKDPVVQLDRAVCDTREAANVTATKGEMTPWLLERELALQTDRIGVPVLMSYGLAELQTRGLAGAFDGIRTPKAGVFGAMDHDYPDENSINPAISRKDWVPMVFAWLDRWLRGKRNGVERWPVAQVQSPDGQWRSEPGFPQTGGPRARLALGAAGALGLTKPSGSTSYLEVQPGGAEDWLLRGDERDFIGTDQRLAGPTFSTPPLKAPLELVGGLRADLWVTTNQPDARIYSSLAVFDAQGARSFTTRVNSFRSLQYLEPKVRERFVQTQPHPAPVNTPLHVILDFPATDLVVPEGGHVELSFRTHVGTMGPAGRAATITVLHDCAHPSSVTFRLPRARADWLDVLDGQQTAGALGRLAAPTGLRDGAGLASQPVCGRAVR